MLNIIFEYLKNLFQKDEKNSIFIPPEKYEEHFQTINQ